MTAVLIPMAYWKGQVFLASWGCKQCDVQPEQNGFLLMAKIGANFFVWLVVFLLLLFVLLGFFFNPCRFQYLYSLVVTNGVRPFCS